MKNFLIIQLARFGDLIQTKRLIKTLELRGQVHLCIDESLKELASIVYPLAKLHTLPVHASPNPELVGRIQQAIQKLTEHNFDAVYNLNHSGLNRALARLFEPEQVIGYQMHGAQCVHSAWIKKAFTWTKNRTISPMNLVDFWAFFDKTPCPSKDINPKPKGGGKGIGIVLAGRQSRRSLPPKILAQVVRTFFECMDGPTLYLLGSLAEKNIAKQLMRNLPAHMLDKVHDLSGKTNFIELVDVLQGLDIVLTPDTGIMHLAAHLGVPVQAFFLSSAWCHETGPYGEGHGVWQSVYECAPCLESTPCPINTKCLEDFNSREFLRALAQHAIERDEAKKTKLMGEFPKHMVYYKSYIDELGSTWQLLKGEDENFTHRLNLRAVIAEQRGVGLPSVAISDEMANVFYTEADWMFATNV